MKINANSLNSEAFSASFGTANAQSSVSSDFLFDENSASGGTGIIEKNAELYSFSTNVRVIDKNHVEYTNSLGMKCVDVYDDNGELMYSKSINKDGNISLSSGKYGNNKEEGIKNLVKELKSAGLQVRVIGDTIYTKQANVKGNSFYKMNNDGTVNTLGWTISDFVSNENSSDETSELQEGIQIFMEVYSKLHPSAHYALPENNELMIFESDKRTLVHFNDSGKVDYQEIISKDGDYQLSEGKFGKNKDEAIAKIMNLLNEHGQKPAIVNDTIVVNKDDTQLHYKVESDGTVKQVQTITDEKDFIGIRQKVDKQDKNNKAVS